MAIEIAPGVTIGGAAFPVIAGPCAVESEALVLEAARAVQANRRAAWSSA